MRQVLFVLFAILVAPTLGIAGDIQTDGKLKSTAAQGAPLEVASADMVVNLNADMVDGVQGTDIYTKAEVDALVTVAVESAGPRKFYLSLTVSDGSSALTACATGFHMASIWEIYDPSTLQYAWDHADATVTVDSGFGPPATHSGWVRTGSLSHSTEVVGQANCSAYTSNGFSDYGTRVFLQDYWLDPGGSVTAVPGSPWYAYAFSCAFGKGTWCIED